MQTRLHALVLDLDGVLADTEPLHDRAWDTVLAGIPPEMVAQVRQKWVGMASAAIARELIAAFGLTLSVEEMLAEKRRRFRGADQGGPQAVSTGSRRSSRAGRVFPLRLPRQPPALKLFIPWSG